MESAQKETGLIVTFTNAFDEHFSRQIKSHLTFLHQIKNYKLNITGDDKEPFS